MSLKSHKHPCVTLALIASMPRVFEAVQDKCITKANCKKDSKSFYVSSELGNCRIEVAFGCNFQIKYSFSCLQCLQFYADMDQKTGDALNISKPIPLPALNVSVTNFHPHKWQVGFCFHHCRIVQRSIWRDVLCSLRLWSVTEESNSWHIR